MKTLGLMLIVLFLQITSAKLFGGVFCDFLTPLLLLWTIDKKPQLMIFWTLLMGILVSLIFPQPFLVLLLSFFLAQWIFRASFFEEWRTRPGRVFLAGVVFSLFWQTCGLAYATVFADLFSTPLFFLPLVSSLLTAGLVSVLFFYCASKKAEMEGRAW